MKMNPELEKARQQMLPGVITQSGFLGTDPRPLGDIIEADEEAMALAGLSYEEVAERLSHLLTEGLKGLGEPITVDNIWLVRVNDARGKLACPFHDGIQGKTAVSVVRTCSNTELMFSELSLHLFRDHHFHQGKGSPFRLDVETIQQVLAL